MEITKIGMLIYVVRGQRVMMDRDLAALYGVPTKVLNQAVQRNLEFFPGDFMFKLSPIETRNWRSHIVIAAEQTFAPGVRRDHARLRKPAAGAGGQ